MKEKPILFSTDMVKAILDSRKTMTRRVMKPQPGIAPGIGHVCKHGSDNSEEWIDCCCPYRVGMRLWVRETFNGGINGIPVAYKATNPELNGAPWKPSIFMPRKFSRINLEIINVRVERLQDITENDAKDEGCESAIELGISHLGYKNIKTHYIECFKTLWNSINTKRGYGWNVNPWVWVIEFKKI